jgi:hypothetical protein
MNLKMSMPQLMDLSVGELIETNSALDLKLID